MQHQTIGCNNIPSFLQWTAHIARSFCEGCTWHHLHILVKPPVCSDWKCLAASMQSFTLWQQATIKIPRHAYFISTCSCHLGVVLHAHPIRGELHIHHKANWEAATLAAMGNHINFSRVGNVDISLILFKVANDAMEMNLHKTLSTLSTLSTPQRNFPTRSVRIFWISTRSVRIFWNHIEV